MLNNITIVNSSVSGDNRVGGVTGYSSGSTITNVNVSNVIASSPGSVGGIIGDTYQSTLTNLEGDHIEVIGDYTVGIALASLSNQSRLENCRITNSTASGTGSWIGGCVGYLQTAEAIDVHCEDVRVNGRGEVGGCFGRVERNATVSEVHCENVFVESSSYSTGGCSGLIQENSNISNITCNNVTVNGTNYVGCAIGKINNSQLSICNITDSTATGTKEVGGCAGYVANNSTFNDITCEHLIVKATGDRSGGFVGSTETNCSFTDITCDDVNVEGNGYVGCAFGTISNGTLTTCNITDSMASSTSWQAGGCAGQANGGSNLSGVVCQNLQINAGGDYAGGCIGQTFGNCEFSDILCDNVSVECAAGKQGLGGLMGYCIHSTKDNCRVINSRVGNGSSNGVCGGLVGELGHYYADTSTNNCFVRNTDILSTSYCIGGLFGSANNAGDISNCFVDDCRITGSDRSGGFSGQFGGDNRLNSCYVASISLDTTGDYIGGFVGRSESSITSCYTERVKILAKSHSVGGLVGYQTVDGVIELSHATRAKIEVDDRTQNRQCYGGLVGQSSGTISLSYVDDSDIDSFQNVGGLVGYCPGGSVSKCFVKDTRVKGYNLVIGGLAAQVSLEAQVDSCYVKNCNVSCTVEMNALDHGISGLVASNSGDITNCYTYNTTVTGKSGYGALVGINGNAGEATTIANCFIRENYSTLIDYNQNSTPLTSCYYNVGDLAAFKAQTWSDGKTIEGGSTAWSNFNRTSFPPQLTELPEP